jgi:site-specific DNA recombinase
VNAGQADPVAGGGFRTYRCNRAIGGCGRTWRSEWLDDYINGLVGERLSRRDARGMLSLDANPEAEELSDEAQGIRVRLRALATDHLLKGVDITDAVEAANARLKEIEQLTRPHADEVLAPLLTADNPAKRYNAYADVVQRQAVISRLMTVTLLAPPRGKWPEENRAAWYLERAVRIDWRTR